MITLILAVTIGIFFTAIAVDNSQLTDINIFGNVFSFPLYLSLGLSFLLGAFFTSLSSIFDWTSASFDLKKREKNLTNTQKINQVLQSDIEKLQKENTSLREELNLIKTNEKTRKNEERKETVRNFFHRLTHPQKPEHPHIA